VEQFVALGIRLEGDNPTRVTEPSEELGKLAVVCSHVEGAVHVGDAEKLLEVRGEGIGEWPPDKLAVIATEELMGAGF
jgi:hypothetical protein